MTKRSILPVSICLFGLVLLGNETGAEPAIVKDALGGTLARDRQSRMFFFNGKHRRTYIAYMDHDFNARVIYYDHETKHWSESVLVDDCIAETGWCKGVKDGHNVPNIWVSKSGAIHLLYGSHGTPFKDARSAEPERTERWELDKRVGNYATYPFYCELPGGGLLIFCRYSPTGGYNNPFLGMLRSKDDGCTWSDVNKLGAFGQACKLNGKNAVFEPRTKRIYLNLALKPKEAWRRFLCQYDPADDHMYSWDGSTDLGKLPGGDELVEHGLVDGKEPWEIFLHDGVLCMLLQGYAFAVWDGEQFTTHDIPGDRLAGIRHGPMWTDDGRRIRLFGIRETAPDTPFAGGDLYVRTSADAGATWDSGRCVIDRRELGRGLQGVNIVTNYPGDGPFLIVAEATGKLPYDFAVTRDNHYDNPWRKNKRLYALDHEGNSLSNSRE